MSDTSDSKHWMDYFPDFMSPFGMVFYSVLIFVFITLHAAIKRRTIETYVDKSMRTSMQSSLLENRRKKGIQADAML